MFKFKLLSILPQFIYKRLVSKFFKEKEESLEFEEMVSSEANILDNLFDGESDLFISNLKNCNIYGEYGCGLSTVYANQYIRKITISVDSDFRWTEKVKNSVDSTELLNIKAINLGKVKEFGIPESYSFKENISEYLQYIWIQNKKPDFILIDGRFRVATFLTTLINAKKGTTVCFDDYTTRPQYHIVEKFEKPLQKNKRQAIFKVNNNYNLKELMNYIDKFEYVFD